eukprot:Amastigsp_a841418_285.p1 type:complete len:196 gc:universal Amastigsp_a841418_285:450-1037(+)
MNCHRLRAEAEQQLALLLPPSSAASRRGVVGRRRPDGLRNVNPGRRACLVLADLDSREGASDKAMALRLRSLRPLARDQEQPALLQGRGRGVESPNHAAEVLCELEVAAGNADRKHKARAEDDDRTPDSQAHDTDKKCRPERQPRDPKRVAELCVDLGEYGCRFGAREPWHGLTLVEPCRCTAEPHRDALKVSAV